MATIYVWSGATGANNGTSWTDAYATLLSAWNSWAQGDVVYLASDHSETQATEMLFTTKTPITPTNPFVMYSVDRADNSYLRATSAQIAVTGTGIDIDFDENFHAYGVWFRLENGHFDIYSFGQFFRFFECTFEWSSPSTTRYINIGSGWCLLDDCAFVNLAGSPTAGISLIGSYADARVLGGTVTGYCTAAGFVASSQSAGTTVVEGIDLSGALGLSRVVNAGSNAILTNCKLPSGIPVTSASNFFTMTYNNASAVDGSSTAKNYLAETYNRSGSVIQDTGIYRDAGWTDEDGSTQLSHKIVPTSNVAVYAPTFGPDLRAYVASTGTKTFTIYCVHDYTTAPTKNELWLVVSYLGTADSVLASVGGGRAIFSSATWTVGSEAWTGASGKTKLELSFTGTVNKSGTYRARVFLGKYESGKFLWYCPQVEVT